MNLATAQVMVPLDNIKHEKQIHDHPTNMHIRVRPMYSKYNN